MKLNRRKALIGIGSLAVGSGAALGSGAFTSVEAERTVTVETVADSNATLGLSSGSDYVSDDSSSRTLELDLGGGSSNGLNDDAITDLGTVLSISNNSADDNQKTVSLASSTDQGSLSVNDGNGDGAAGSDTVTLAVSPSDPEAEVEFTLAENGNGGVALDSGSTQEVEATVRTGTETTLSNLDTAPEGLVIIAESST